METFTLPSTARLATTAFIVGILSAAPASAQVGTAFTPLAIATAPSYASIRIYTGQNTIDQMNAAGGVTLFAATAPNGTVLARVPYFPPFLPNPNELDPTYGWDYPGVPPGTYYVAVILGIVAAPNIAPGDWTQLVVPGGCAGPPGTGLVSREVFGNTGNNVRLRLASWGGCASTYLVDLGTSPGAANLGSFPVSSGVLGGAAVPAGTYYVRVRGQNAAGIGAYSAVLPVTVPACSTIDEDDYALTSTVVGSQVTLNWTPKPPPPGGPVTFYELALFAPSVPLEAWPHILLPTPATSISASVPPGAYTVALLAGNSCGSWLAGVVAFTVP